MFKTRQVYEWCASESRGVSADDLAALVRSMFGKHTRVTVEEEVSECCEKWRGKSIYTIEDASRFQAGGTVLMHQEPEFCPRCGRKL